MQELVQRDERCGHHVNIRPVYAQGARVRPGGGRRGWLLIGTQHILAPNKLKRRLSVPVPFGQPVAWL